MAGEGIYEQLDDAFAPLAKGDVRLRLLHDGAGWLEGPVWVPTARCLLFSDIPADRILRWDEATGAVTTHVGPSRYANGNTLDHLGRLVSCEQGTRSVVRTEHDGSRTTLADAHGGARLNSPNDVVVRSDGTVYFTDPDYGIRGDYEGYRAPSEQDGCHVYRVDPDGRLSRAATGFVQPNGLAFGLGESQLFVSDSEAGRIAVLDVAADGTLGEPVTWTEEVTGSFDGLRLDVDGRVWSAGDGVHCYAPDGRLIGRIRTPEPVANLAFGGARRTTLFLCASTALWSLRLPVAGAPPAYVARPGAGPGSGA